MDSVRNFATKVQKKFSSVDLLINNGRLWCCVVVLNKYVFNRFTAGILFVPYQKTKDGFETQMAVNYLGHFLLSHLLMPQLIAASNKNDGKNSRIVSVSSCANECGQLNYADFNYEKEFHTGLAYGDSKLAQIVANRHVEKLCRENDWKVQNHFAHPGLVDTEIFLHSIWGSLTWIRKILFKVSLFVISKICN